MSGGGGSFLILIIVMGGMLFFMSRSQKKQQQKRQEVLDSMSIGSHIITIGGLHGVLVGINNDKNTIELDCEGVILEFNKTAVATVNPPDKGVAKDAVVEEEVIETVSEESEA